MQRAMQSIGRFQETIEFSCRPRKLNNAVGIIIPARIVGELGINASKPWKISLSKANGRKPVPVASGRASMRKPAAYRGAYRRSRSLQGAQKRYPWYRKQYWKRLSSYDE